MKYSVAIVGTYRVLAIFCFS